MSYDFPGEPLKFTRQPVLLIDNLTITSELVRLAAIVGHSLAAIV